MNFDPEHEFLLLKRELQQHVPIARIFAHIETILKYLNPPEFQIHFIQQIVNTTTDQSKFDSRILKKLSSFLFKKFDDFYGKLKYALEDEFVSFFMERSDVIVESGKCDRFYEISHNNFIQIKSSESIISEGTTGYSLWEASVALLAILMSKNQEINSYFRNKRVLELGSGTGLGGIAIASLCDPLKVQLTDVTQVHNSYTHPNSLLNKNQFKCEIDSQIVYWNDLVEDPDEISSQFDTILGCDLVYDPQVCPILLEALKSLLNSSNSNIKQVFLICTLRNPETFNSFVSDLKLEKNFLVSVKSLEGYYDPNTNPIILQSIESFRIIFINK